MRDTIKDSRSLEHILQSVSDVLFPAGLGEKAVNLDSRGSDGDTPLHVMVWRGDRSAVELLINSGADVDARGDMGATPLHVAISQGDESMIETLLRAGARADIRSEFNESALEKAEKSGGPIERLIKRYVDG